MNNMTLEQIAMIARESLRRPEEAAALLLKIAEKREGLLSEHHPMHDLIDALIAAAACAPHQQAGYAACELIHHTPPGRLLPLIAAAVHDPDIAARLLIAIGPRIRDMDRNPEMIALADNLITAAARAESARAGMALSSLAHTMRETERILVLGSAIRSPDIAASVISRLSVERRIALLNDQSGRRLIADLAYIAARDPDHAAAFLRSLLACAPSEPMPDLAWVCASSAVQTPYGAIKTLAALGPERIARLNQNPEGRALINTCAETAASGEPWCAARAFIALSSCLSLETCERLISVVAQNPMTSADVLSEMKRSDILRFSAGYSGVALIATLINASEAAPPDLASQAFAALAHAIPPDHLDRMPGLQPLLRAIARQPWRAMATLERIGEDYLRTLNETRAGAALLDELLAIAASAPDRAAPDMALFARVVTPERLTELINAIARDPESANMALNVLLMARDCLVQWKSSEHGRAILENLMCAGVRQPADFPDRALLREFEHDHIDIVWRALASAPDLDAILARLRDMPFDVKRNIEKAAERSR